MNAANQSKDTQDRAAGTFGRDVFWPCLVVSLCLTAVLQLSGMFYRTELQNINRLFEARQWLCWSAKSLQRLHPEQLWQYHQQHEVPRNLLSWDYTLSWLIEPNHPPSKHKFIIFNHGLEDEPPQEAVNAHPWMQPLMQYPPRRKTIAEVVDYLANAGAALIILDNDFPQYSSDDAALALAIHRAAEGQTSGRRVPVLMASTVNHNGFSNLMQLDASTMPVGVLSELQKLEPGADVARRYTGITSVAPDEDQVVRRLVTRIGSDSGKLRESLALKALDRLGETIPDDLPTLMDVDFAAPPNSDLYPVRPFWYLLDPDKRKAMVDPDCQDVTVPGAVVLIGDGIIDVYSTPGTNLGVSLMSGTEIIAHSIDTISRHSWPVRLDGANRWLYLAACCLFGSLGIACARRLRPRTSKLRLGALAECGLYVVINALIFAVGLAIFAVSGTIVPIVLPAVALTAGVTVTLIAEREQARVHALNARIAAAEATLTAERERYAMQMHRQETEAKEQRIAFDQRRRKEFIRAINHDLKAPVTVLNWTLSKLKREGLRSAKAADRLDHLERTSDRLFDLMAQLVRSYEQEDAQGALQPPQVCDLTGVLLSCTQMEDTLAEVRRANIRLDLPESPLPVVVGRVDMERVLDNVLRNALIHNPQGTNVEVSARLRAQFVQLTIADNGRGIPADALPHIFEDGFTTSVPQQHGDGLGMTIVKSIVEKYGGSVSVESIEDAGTTVTILVPLAVDTAFGALSAATGRNSNSQGAVICRKL